MYQCPDCKSVGVGNCDCPAELRDLKPWPATLHMRSREGFIYVQYQGEDLGPMDVYAVRQFIQSKR